MRSVSRGRRHTQISECAVCPGRFPCWCDRLGSGGDRDRRELSELIAEVEREENELQHIRSLEVAATSITKDCSDAFSYAKATPDALVALVKKEVRAAMDKEFNAAFHSPSPRHSFHRHLPRQSDDECGEEEPKSGSSDQAAGISQLSTAASSSGAGECVSPGPPVAAASAVALELVQARLAEHGKSLEDMQTKIKWQMSRLDEMWKYEAELRAEGDQEVENRLRSDVDSKLETLEATVKQVVTSFSSHAKLQAELDQEARTRQDADGRLQDLLRDFRASVVNENEEMRGKHQQLSSSVDGMRRCLKELVELVELRSDVVRNAAKSSVSSADPSLDHGRMPIAGDYPQTVVDGRTDGRVAETCKKNQAEGVGVQQNQEHEAHSEGRRIVALGGTIDHGETEPSRLSITPVADAEPATMVAAHVEGGPNTSRYVTPRTTTSAIAGPGVVACVSRIGAEPWVNCSTVAASPST